MNQHTYDLARDLHKMRLQEALERQRHKLADDTRSRLPSTLLAALREHVSNLMMRLKTQPQSEFA